jgi:hypothetical protein
MKIAPSALGASGWRPENKAARYVSGTDVRVGREVVNLWPPTSSLIWLDWKAYVFSMAAFSASSASRSAAAARRISAASASASSFTFTAASSAFSVSRFRASKLSSALLRFALPAWNTASVPAAMAAAAAAIASRAARSSSSAAPAISL